MATSEFLLCQSWFNPPLRYRREQDSRFKRTADPSNQFPNTSKLQPRQPTSDSLPKTLFQTCDPVFFAPLQEPNTVPTLPDCTGPKSIHKERSWLLSVLDETALLRSTPAVAKLGGLAGQKARQWSDTGCPRVFDLRMFSHTSATGSCRQRRSSSGPAECGQSRPRVIRIRSSAVHTVFRLHGRA